MNSSDQADQRGEILSEELQTFGGATNLGDNGIEVSNVSSIEVEENWSRSQKQVETGSIGSLEVSESGGHVSERESDPSIALVENIQNEEVLKTEQGNQIVKQENVSPQPENAGMNQELFDVELPNDAVEKAEIGEAILKINIKVDEMIEKESSTKYESTVELTDVGNHQPIGSNILKESNNSSNQLEELLDDNEKPNEVVEIISVPESPILYTQIESNLETKDTKGETDTNKENTEESDTENITLTITLDNIGIEATSAPVVEVYSCNEETVRQIKGVLEMKENEPITISYNDQENKENVESVVIKKSTEEICDVQDVPLLECIIGMKSQIQLEEVVEIIQDKEDSKVVETMQGAAQQASDQSEEFLYVNEIEQSNEVVERNSVTETHACCTQIEPSFKMVIVDDQVKKENDENVDRNKLEEEIIDVPLLGQTKTEEFIELFNDETEIEPLKEPVTEFEVVEDQPEKENIEDVKEQAKPEEEQMSSEAIEVETEGEEPETNVSIAFIPTRIDEPIEVIDSETLEVTQDNDNEQPDEVSEEMVQEEFIPLNEEKLILVEKLRTQLEELGENIEDKEDPIGLDSVQGSVQQSSDQSEEFLYVNELEQSNEVVERNSVTETHACCTQIEPSFEMVIVDDHVKKENDENVDRNKLEEEIIDVPLLGLAKTEESIELLNDETEIEPLKAPVTEFEVVEDQPEKENIEDVKEKAKPEEEQMSSEAIEVETEGQEPETNVSIAFIPTRIDEPIEFIDSETLEATQNNDSEKPTEVSEETVKEEYMRLNEENLIFDEKSPTQLEELKVELITVVPNQPLQSLGASSLQLAAGLENNDGIQEAIVLHPIESPKRSGSRKPEWMRKSLSRKGSVRRFFGRKKSKRFNHDSLPVTETPPQPTAPPRPLRKIISDFFLMLFES